MVSLATGSIACAEIDPQACWSSHPGEWQPLLGRWKKEYPELVTLHSWEQRGGQKVRGITITRPGPAAKAFRLLIAVPHAHEPASTAACVDFACQLLTGRHRDGSPATDLAAIGREKILSRGLITFLPDTNSQGRAKAPERWWNGQQDNASFLKIAFGIASNGLMFGRYPEWRPSEHKPKQIGIVYEQVEEDLYVESNTSRRATHSKAIDDTFARYRHTHHLDMHQHEGDEAVLLPATYDEMLPEQKALIARWGEQLVEAWRAAGANPQAKPFVPYAGNQRQQFFKAFWADRCPGMMRLTSEVRNNRHRKTGEPTPLSHQFRMAMIAISTTVQFGLEMEK